MNPTNTALDPSVTRAVAEAARVWPALELSHSDFVRHLQELLNDSQSQGMTVDTLHVADLYLAYGCMQRDAAALTELHRLCWGPVQRAVERVLQSAELTSDLWQEMLARLVYPEDGKRPRLSSYAGKGPLSAWVAISARRLALDWASQRSKETSLDEALGEPQSPEAGAAQPLKAYYRAQAQAILQGALESLALRDRQLLQLHLRGLSFSGIGRLHGVDKSTVFHWFRRIRETLREATKAGFGPNMRDSELASIIRMVKSQLELSLSGLGNEH